jgi:hypothetical protein
MSSESFPEVLEQARLASAEVCDKAKLILRKALPNVSALQQANSHFSPRLMSLMCLRAEGTLSEPDRELLGSALRYVEEFQIIHITWVMALKEAAPSLDVSAASAQCGEAVEMLRRLSADLDCVLGRTGTRSA